MKKKHTFQHKYMFQMNTSNGPQDG